MPPRGVGENAGEKAARGSKPSSAGSRGRRAGGRDSVPGSADEKGAARYRPRLFSIAYGMTGSVGDAEDTEVNCRQIFARAGQRIAPGTRPASSPTARAGRVRQR